MPLATLACTVDASGISAPTYAAIYQSLQQSYQAIFGTDGYIDPDSQDGQLLAVIAKAMYDGNAADVFVYNNFSPASAQGAGLSSSVKLDGLHRRVPTSSTADVNIGGTANTIITGGVISDAAGANLWTLPSPVVIPNAGTVTVTATCETQGAVEALANTLTKIVTPTVGWQTVTNPTEAVPGAPVETDAQLRRRQSLATQLPSSNNVGAILSGLGQLLGVTDVAIHENFTGVVDSDGVPGHTIAVVIEGGDVNAIASMIALKKDPGCGLYGTTSVATFDPNGLPITVEFSRPVDVNVAMVVDVHPLNGYSSNVTAAIQASLTSYIDALLIGDDVVFNRLWVPASLANTVNAGTFEINAMTANAGTANIPVGYNERAVCTGVTVNLV